MLVRRRRFRLRWPLPGKDVGVRRPPLPAGLAALLGGLPAGALIVRYLMGSRFLVLDVLFCLQPLRILYVIPGAILVVLAAGRRPAWLFCLAVLVEALLFWETAWDLGLARVFARRARAVENAVSFTVLTQNVNLGDPAAWEDLLRKEKPDVACFQEAYVNHLKGWNDLAKAVKCPHTAFQILREDAGMGSFVCSRWPIEVQSPVETISSGGVIRRFLRVVVKTPAGPVHIFSVHLESAPRKSGVSGFVASWPLRYAQAADLASEVRALAEPVLVCGDMNATPTERALVPLGRVLRDAWPSGGYGLGGTWPAGFPCLRLDQVWFRGDLEPVDARVGPAVWSDHRAVLVTFRLSSRESRRRNEE